jgi:hypothetical protein
VKTAEPSGSSICAQASVPRHLCPGICAQASVPRHQASLPRHQASVPRHLCPGRAPKVPRRYGAGDNIGSLWSVKYEDFSTPSLLLFVPVYFVFAAWTSGMAIPSGSFSPTIFLGSCLGRLYAHIVGRLGVVSDPDAGLYALLGAAGFFTGA